MVAPIGAGLLSEHNGKRAQAGRSAMPACRHPACLQTASARSLSDLRPCFCVRPVPRRLKPNRSSRSNRCVLSSRSGPVAWPTSPCGCSGRNWARSGASRSSSRTVRAPAACIAQQALLASPPDGYAMSVTGNGTAIGMSLFKTRPYDILKDFTQVSITATFEMLLVTRSDAPFKTDGRRHRVCEEESGQDESRRDQSRLHAEPVCASVQAADWNRRHDCDLPRDTRSHHRRDARRH